MEEQSMKKQVLILILVFSAFSASAQWIPVGAGLGNFPPTSMFSYIDSVYLGTYGGGLFRTLDNGSTWTAINGNLENLDINDIRPGPISTCVFVATANGPYFTQNLATYENCTSTGLTNTDIRYFWFGNDDEAEWAIGTHGGGVFTSPDYAGPWTERNTGISGSGLTVNDIGGYSDNSIDFSVMGTDGGVYYSFDNLTTWTEKNNGLTGNALLVKKLTGLGPMVLIATRGGLYLSLDLGDTWTAYVPMEILNTVMIIQSPLSSTGFYIFTFGEHGYYSEDLMNFYSIDFTGLPEGEITCATVNSTHMFLGVTTPEKSGGGIFRKPMEMVVSVDDIEKNPSLAPLMIHIYPNPFSHQTSISYFVDEPGQVTLLAYNGLGQLAGTLYKGFQEKGYHTLPFIRKDNTPGFHYVVLKINNSVRGTKKMIVLD